MRIAVVLGLLVVLACSSSSGSTTLACKSPGEPCTSSTECQQWECSCTMLPANGKIRECKSNKCVDMATACATLGCTGAFTATVTGKACTPPDSGME